MKLFTAVISTLLLLALCAVAVELYRIDAELRDMRAVSLGFAKMFYRAPETRAERDARLQHETQEVERDAIAIATTPHVPRRPTGSVSPAGTPAPARPPRQ